MGLRHVKAEEFRAWRRVGPALQILNLSPNPRLVIRALALKFASLNFAQRPNP